MKEATGTIGVEVAKALSLSKHEVVRASRDSHAKVDLDDPASIRAMFEKVHDADAVTLADYLDWVATSSHAEVRGEIWYTGLSPTLDRSQRNSSDEFAAAR